MKIVFFPKMIFTTLFILFNFTAYTFAEDSAATKNNTVRIISLTDFHGALETDNTTVKNKDGRALRVAGASFLSSYVNILREDKIPTVLIDGGDLFQGTLVSNSVEGRPVVDFYNYLKMDAVAIGNHEFDYGPQGPKTVPKDPMDDPRGALKERMNQAKFPFLAANIRQKTGELPEWAKPSILIERDGWKIGIIGVATTSTPSTTLRKNVDDLYFIDPAEPILQEVENLKNKGAQILVLAIHAGGGCRINYHSKQHDLSTCEAGELSELLSRLPENIVDVVVAGHTHKGIAKYIRGIAVLQSFSHGKAISWVDISLKEGQKTTKMSEIESVCGDVMIINGRQSCIASVVSKESGEIKPAKFLGKPVVEDEAVVNLLKADFARVAEIKKEPLNTVVEDQITRSYYDENALGNLLTDVLRASRKDVDFVMLNNGGLRANLQPAPLTYGDIYSVLPFDNFSAIVTMDGATLLKATEIGISRNSGGYSWSGLYFTADSCKVESVFVSDTKEQIQPMKIYRMLTVDFIATGGSGFLSLGLKPEQIEILESDPVMRDTVANNLKTFSKPLRSSLYYDAKNPRLNIKKECGEGN